MMGLGFSFGARDTGMLRTIDGQTRGLGLMETAVGKLNDILKVNRLSAFIDSISLSRLNDISDGIERISTTGRNLTTSLEGEFQQMSRSSAAFGVSVGLTGESLKTFKKQVASASYETGIGVDEMNKAFHGFQPVVGTLKKLGLSTGKDFAKFAEVSGVSADKFGWALGQMQKQIGVTDEDAASLVAQMARFGQTTNDLGGTLNNLPNLQKLFNARKALGDSPKRIAQMGQQVFALGEVMFNAGIEGAGELATHIFQLTTDSKTNFKDMLVGASGDLADFQKALAVGGMDLGKVFKAMDQGPAEFIATMAQQVDVAQKSGKDVSKALDFMRGHLQQTFGKDQTNALVTALADPVKRGTLAAVKTMASGTDALGKIVKEGYEGRFTLAEQFDRAEAMMVHRFRSVARKETSAFVTSSQAAFKQFGDSVQKVAAEKGPLGMLVRKLSLAHQIGAQAFIPEVMRPLVTLSGSAVKEMAPMLGMLGSLGFRFSMLLNPVNLLLVTGGALIAWFMALRLQGKSTTEALMNMGDTVANFVSSIPRYLHEGLSAIIGWVSTLGDKTKKAGPDWSLVAGAWLDRIKASFKTWAPVLVAEVGFLFGKLAGYFKEKAPGLLKALGDGLKSYYATLGKVIPWVVDKALSFVEGVDFGALVSFLGDGLVDLLGGALERIGPLISGVFDRLPEFLLRAWDKVLDIAKTVPGALGKFLAGLGVKLRDVLPGVLKGLFKFILNIPGMILNMFVSLVQNLPAILSGLGELLKGALSMLVDVLIGIATGFIDAVKETFPGLASYVDGAVGYFQNLWSQVKYLWNEASIWIQDFWTNLKGWVQTGMENASTVISAFTDAFTAPFRAIDGFVDKLFRNSISTDMKVDFAEATKHAAQFGKDVNRSMGVAVAPLASVSPSAGEVASAGGAKIPPPLPLTGGAGTAERQASLLAAVNNPAWYARYEALFAQSMDRLISAVEEPVKGGRRTPVPTGGRAGGRHPGDMGLGGPLLTDTNGSFGGNR